jgi:hypothetical protein
MWLLSRNLHGVLQRTLSRHGCKPPTGEAWHLIWTRTVFYLLELWPLAPSLPLAVVA